MKGKKSVTAVLLFTQLALYIYGFISFNNFLCQKYQMQGPKATRMLVPLVPTVIKIIIFARDTHDAVSLYLYSHFLFMCRMDNRKD